MNKNQNEVEFAGKTDSQLKAEHDALEQERRELELVLLRTQVAEVRRVQQAALDKARSQQQAISQFLANRRAQQLVCTHRKGGVGHESVIRGAGNSAMHCVAKHKLPSGAWMVLCMRCGAEWHGPLTALQNGGTPRKATKIGKITYWDAIQFATNNSESGSSQFVFSEARPVDLETEDDE